MVLDLLAFRAHDGGVPDDVRESQRRRGRSVSQVDAIIAADAQWRAASKRANDAKGALSKAKAAGRGKVAAVNPGERPKSKDELVEFARVATTTAADEQAAQAALQTMLLQTGNIVHEHAPMGDDDDDDDPDVGASLPATGSKDTPHGEASSSSRAAEQAALRRLLAAGLAEEVAATKSGDAHETSTLRWRPKGAALLLVHAWTSHALQVLSKRGYVLQHAPVHATNDRRAKLEKLCRERGEPVRMVPNLDALPNAIGALHACTWLQPSDLPVRYALLAGPSDEPYGLDEHACGDGDAEDGGGGDGGIGGIGFEGFEDGCGCEGAPPALWLTIACADDDSCWAELEDVAEMCEEIYAELLPGVALQTCDVSARRLGRAEARASTLRVEAAVVGTEVVGGASDPMELARACCEFDYRARRLGIRCGHKQLGERTKRHVNTLRACVLRPAAALLALGAALEQSGGSAALPERVCVRWGLQARA